MPATRSIKEIVSICGSRIWNRQMLTFLFFILLATSFWIFQKLTETHEQEMRIPLKVVSTSRNFNLTCELPEALNLTLRDRGTTLLTYYTTNRFDTLVIDLDKYVAENGRFYITRNELQTLLHQQLDRSTQVLTTKPESLEIFYNHGSTRTVPVRLATQDFHLPADIAFQSADLRIQQVEVATTEALPDTITAAYLLPSLPPTLRHDTTFVAQIQPVRGARFTPNAVPITLHVEQISSRTIHVPVRQINFPADKQLRTFPATVAVQFEAPASRLKTYTADDFLILVSYEDILFNRSSRLHLTLRSAPEGTRRAHILKPEVDYLIEEVRNEE